MSEHYRKIASLLESQAMHLREADSESLTGMVRAVIMANLDDIAFVANLVASGKSPAARNNQLDKLRVIMGRVCKELGLPQYTVVKQGSSYVARPVTRKNDPRRYGQVIDGLKDLVKNVALLTKEEQVGIIEEFRAALRLLERGI